MESGLFIEFKRLFHTSREPIQKEFRLSVFSCRLHARLQETYYKLRRDDNRMAKALLEKISIRRSRGHSLLA
jgi:hypothetical protein